MSPTLEEFRRWLQGERVEADDLPAPPGPKAGPRPGEWRGRTGASRGPGEWFEPPADASRATVIFDRPYLHKAELAPTRIPISDRVLEEYIGDPTGLIQDETAKRGIKWDDVARVERSRNTLTASTVFTVWAVVTVTEGFIDYETGDFRLQPEARKGPDLDKLKKKRPGPGAPWAGGKYFLKTDGRDAVLNFGKHSGKSLTQILDEDPSYLKWMLEQDFPGELTELVEEILTTPKPGGIIPTVYMADL